MSYYDDDYVFDHSKGLFLAVAFTAIGDETENILDPTIGEIVFEKESWGNDAAGISYWNQEKIPTHTCTGEELGLEGSNYQL